MPAWKDMCRGSTWTRSSGDSAFEVLSQDATGAVGQVVFYRHSALHIQRIGRPKRKWLQHPPDAAAIPFVQIVRPAMSEAESNSGGPRRRKSSLQAAA